MAKVKKQKYYAVKIGKNTTDKIFNTWEECKPLVTGCKSVYKSFIAEEDAKHYLKVVDSAMVIEQTKKGMEKHKKLKATTRLIQARIPKELHDQFIKKCEEMEQDTSMVILNMIKEWIE